MNKKTVHKYAIASLVLGILGFFIPLVPSILAIIFGRKALSKKPEDKFAIAGLVFGAFGIIISSIIIIFSANQIIGYFRGENLIKDAMLENDPGMCAKISDEFYNQKCYHDVAVKTKDAAICDSITDLGWKDSCFRQVAIEMSEESLCSEIETDDWRKYTCFVSIGEKKQDITICDEIEDTDVYDLCTEKIIGNKVGVIINVVDSKLMRLLPWVQVTLYDSLDNEIISREQGKDSMQHLAWTKPFYLKPGKYTVWAEDIDDLPEYRTEETEIEVKAGAENEFEIIMTNPDFEGMCTGENDHWGFETMQWKSRPTCLKGASDAETECWKAGDCEGRCVYNISGLSREEFMQVDEGTYMPDQPGRCSVILDYRCTGDYILNENGQVEFTCLE